MVSEAKCVRIPCEPIRTSVLRLNSAAIAWLAHSLLELHGQLLGLAIANRTSVRSVFRNP